MDKVAAVVVLVALAFSGVNGDIPNPFVGVTTAVYNGSMVRCTPKYCESNGYGRALEACQTEFPGSRVCSTHDLGVIAQSDSSLFIILGKGDARYIDMSFAEIFQAGGKEVDLNDCYGFTSDSSQKYSRCLREIIGGPVLPSVCLCSDMLSFMCCTDNY